MPVVQQGDNFIIRNVPIFDEHEDQSRHANLRHVDAGKLNTILTRSLARLKTEYELPVAFDPTNKHTPKPGEQHAPPPVKGGYNNLRIDDFNGRKAIYADIRIPAADYPSIEGFQRRSVEIFPDELALDTLVLLGSKAPARDLGPLTPRAQYSRDGREVVRYEMAAEESPAPESEIPKETTGMSLTPEDLDAIRGIVDETVQSKLDALINQEEADANPEGDQDQDGIPNEVDSDDATGLAVQEPEQYGREQNHMETLRLEDLQRKVERYEREAKQHKAQTNALQRERDTEKYTRELTELRDQGIELERDSELARLMAMKTEEERKAHLGVIKEHYRRDPTFESTAARDAVQYERQTPGSVDPKGVTPEMANRIAVEAAKLGSWEAGKAAVMGTNGKV